MDHPRLLQQVIGHVSANGVALEVEIDVHVFSETRGIVIPIGLGVAERFQYRVRLDEDVLNPGMYGCVISDEAESVLSLRDENILRTFCARPRLV